jgi:hypothetical protein
VRMIVPEPPLLNGSPLTLEAHIEDESEDGLPPPPKRHHREVSEDIFDSELDRAFDGLNDIIAASCLPMPVSIRPIPTPLCPITSRGWTTVRREALLITNSSYRASCLRMGRWFYRTNHVMTPFGMHLTISLPSKTVSTGLFNRI